MEEKFQAYTLFQIKGKKMSSVNRPFKYGPNDRREFITVDNEIAKRRQNDASGNPVYIGNAKVGTSTAEEKWQISYNTYDGSNALLTTTWPQDSSGKPSSEFLFSWDDRATYVYN